MYTCIKACTLGGKAYGAGEIIPADAVLPGRVRALTKQGYIAAQADVALDPPPDGLPQSKPPLLSPPPAPALIMIPIVGEKGITEAPMPPEDVVAAITIRQMKAVEAAAAASGLDTEASLSLLYALEDRKTVTAAALARIEELRKAQEPAPESQNGAQEPSKPVKPSDGEGKPQGGE